jgi:hypothetical protein
LRLGFSLFRIILSFLQGFHTALLPSLIFDVHELSYAAQPARQEPGNVLNYTVEQ